MHRLIIRLLISFAVSLGGLAATTIDFPTSLVTFDRLPFPSATAGGVTVDFFLLPNGTACPAGCAPTLTPFGAVTGLPQSAFEVNDTVSPPSPSDGFLTDEDDGPNFFVHFDYLLRFDVGIPDLSLQVLDYRADGGPSVGDRVWLEVYSTSDWNDTPGFPFAEYEITGGEPDGNIITLAVANPGFSILSARVRFEGADIGTGIDNVAWTTVPEPGTVALFGTGLLALAGFARRRFRS